MQSGPPATALRKPGSPTKSAGGESAGNSTWKKGTAGGTAGSSAGRPLSQGVTNGIFQMVFFRMVCSEGGQARQGQKNA